MNLSMAVVGASGAGKTLFCINFAEYLGARSLSYAEAAKAGRGRGLLSPAEARRLMVGRDRRGNGVVRTFAVHLPPRPYRRLALIDTAALKERSPLPRVERSRLILTLQAIEGADLVLLLIDLSCGDPAILEFNERAGRYLADYCRRQGKLFLIAGSKADLLGGLPEKRRFIAAGVSLVLISSVTRAGFARLKQMILGTSFSAEASSYKIVEKGHGDNSHKQGQKDTFRL